MYAEIDNPLIEEQKISKDNTRSFHIRYNSFWCIQRGIKRTQQFWIYCEKAQFNFCSFLLEVPGMCLSAKSKLMKDEGQTLFIVEDVTIAGDFVRALPMIGPSAQIIHFPKVFLYACDKHLLTLQMSLVVDSDPPFHPRQEQPSKVSCHIEDVTRTSTHLVSPFDFMFRINFQERAEGWFKLQYNLVYDNYLLTSGSSDPFMFNNPRMKKMKEHKFYPVQSLKYMQIYTFSNRQAFQRDYGTLFPDSADLIAKADYLFPKALTNGHRQNQKDAVVLLQQMLDENNVVE